MTMETNIVSSTGRLGIEYRSYDRYYLNSPWGLISEPARLGQFVRLGEQVVRKSRNGVTRCVARVLVPERLFSEASSAVSQYFEAALPTGLKDIQGDDIWILMGAINNPNRQANFAVNSISEQVGGYVPQRQLSTVERINLIRNQGLNFLNEIPEGLDDQILELWGYTFGWNKDEIHELRARLLLQETVEPSNRNLWMSSLCQKDRPISLAMAERLELPIGDGRNIDVIESTEWRTANDFEGNGFMTATAIHLNAQILEDLHPNFPLIFAETNYASGAYRVARGAGMEVPPQLIGNCFIPQVLNQNVVVRDRHILPSELRDFSVLYLSRETLNNDYSSEHRTQILNTI